jgi:hypothetical protein
MFCQLGKGAEVYVSRGTEEIAAELSAKFCTQNSVAAGVLFLFSIFSLLLRFFSRVGTRKILDKYMTKNQIIIRADIALSKWLSNNLLRNFLFILMVQDLQIRMVQSFSTSALAQDIFFIHTGTTAILSKICRQTMYTFCRQLIYSLHTVDWEITIQLTTSIYCSSIRALTKYVSFYPSKPYT